MARGNRRWPRGWSRRRRRRDGRERRRSPRLRRWRLLEVPGWRRRRCRLRRARQRGVRARGRRLCSRRRDRISAGDRRRGRRRRRWSRRRRPRCGRRARRLRDGTFRAHLLPRRGLCLGERNRAGDDCDGDHGGRHSRTSRLRAPARSGAMLRREPARERYLRGPCHGRTERQEARSASGRSQPEDCRKQQSGGDERGV
jgi:hypothetical protein